MGAKKILLVDDDEDLRTVLSVQLRSKGFDVVLASDGISAISMTRREKPNLIILDIGLPAGDGYTVMKRLKHFSVAPILVLSGLDPMMNRERVIKAGAFGFLQKPPSLHSLMDAIVRAIGQPGEPAPMAELFRREDGDDAPPKILLVDDDEDLLTVLSMRLQTKGYDVVVATDGMTAVMIARKENPDLVVLDIGLPGGDGYTVMQRLRYIGSAPVVALSGKDPLEHRQRALDAGAACYLVKPPEDAELLAAIRDALGEASERSGHDQ